MAKSTRKVSTVSDQALRKIDSSSIQRPRGNTFSPKNKKHPINNQANGKLLVEHICARLDNFKTQRDALIDKFQDIDMQISGFTKPETVEDKARDRRNKRGQAARPIKHNLPLTMSQLDEAVTYLLSVFAPEGKLFEAVGEPSKQELLEVFADWINKNGIRVGYYQEFAKFLINAVRYNLAALETVWEKHEGNVIKNDAIGQAEIATDVIWQGNYLKSLDMYNFLYDMNVHPTKLALQGEFYATVELITPFRARKLEQDSLLFYVDRYIDGYQSAASRYYKAKPKIRTQYRNDSGFEPDWVSLMTAGIVQDASANIEVIKYVGWIIPSDFGLSDNTSLELWRIFVANSEYVTFAERINDASGMLPVSVSAPIIDDLDNDQSTYAEMLIPLQHFASFLLNSHQDSVRKSLGGLKVYDPRALGLMDKVHDDLYSAAVPLKATGIGQVDIDKVFRSYNDAPRTEQNVSDVGKILDLMQKILPTDMLKQVTDLDRATAFQAAATVIAGNRRPLKIARMIDTQALSTLKIQMIYNIYLYQDLIETTDPQGNKVQIAPNQLREGKFELEMARGLRGIDKLAVSYILNDVVNKVLQSQQASAEIDIVELLNYMMTIMGDTTNLVSFRRKTAAPALPGTAQPGQSPVTPGAGEQPPIPQG